MICLIASLWLGEHFLTDTSPGLSLVLIYVDDGGISSSSPVDASVPLMHADEKAFQPVCVRVRDGYRPQLGCKRELRLGPLGVPHRAAARQLFASFIPQHRFDPAAS